MSFLLRKLYVLLHSEPEMLSTLQPCIKAKWCDTAYFLAQDLNIESERDVRLIVTRLAVMAFVRVTCCRAGSAAKDWCAVPLAIKRKSLGMASLQGGGVAKFRVV